MRSPVTRAGVPVFALVVVLLAACTRKGGEPARSDAGSAASGAPPSEPPTPSAAVPPTLPDDLPPARDDAIPESPPEASEPRRITVLRLDDDRTLRAHGDLLRTHFGSASPSPLKLQIAPAWGARRAILVLGRPDDRRPFILVVDAEDRLLWTKDHPLAGIAPGVREIALLPGPKGQVAVSFYDAPTRLIALRVWDASGGILADFQLFSIDACDALSALYWPGRGLLVVAAGARGAARAQLLDERGGLPWGREGIALPWASRTGAPVALALVTDSSVVLVQLGEARQATPGGPEHALAARYDASGAALWDRPVDLGPVTPPAGGGAVERIVAMQASEGIVRVSIPQGASRRALEVNSVGVVSAARAR